MTERQGRQFLGNVAGRSAAGGLLPSDRVNIVQSLGRSFNIGAFQGVDPAQLIVLVAGLGAVAVDRYTTFHQTVEGTGLHTAGTDYQVPAGQQLVIGHIMFGGLTAATGIVIGYGDTGVAVDSAAAPTNSVGLVTRTLYLVDTASKLLIFNDVLKVPASKFPYLFSPNAASFGVKLICQLFPA